MSFSFYIPHKRLKLGGHISTQSAIPHPWHLLLESVRIRISSCYHFKLSHALLRIFSNRTARFRKSDVVTVRLRSITLLIWLAQCNFIPSYTPWIAWNTRLQLLWIDTSYGGWHLIHMFNSCNVILLLCILVVDLSIRFSFALLATYTSLSLRFTSLTKRFSGPKGSWCRRILPSYCMWFRYWVQIPIQHFILPSEFAFGARLILGSSCTTISRRLMRPFTCADQFPTGGDVWILIHPHCGVY